MADQSKGADAKRAAGNVIIAEQAKTGQPARSAQMTAGEMKTPGQDSANSGFAENPIDP